VALSIVDDVLESLLLDALRDEPSLTLAKAVELVANLAGMSSEVLTATDAGQLQQRLAGRATSHLVRRGVLNPEWLAAQGIRPHFFLIKGAPKLVNQLFKDAADQGIVSQYVLYGDWDSLVILQGTNEEATSLKSSLTGTAGVDPAYFTVQSIPLLYRTQPVPFDPATLHSFSPDVVNAAVMQLDKDPARTIQLQDAGVICGATWASTRLADLRVVAFVGISFRDPVMPKAKQVLRLLWGSEPLRSSLVHLVETTGWPYPYFAKLVCRDMGELDTATSAILELGIGSSQFRTSTLVVANGRDQIPLYRKARNEALVNVSGIAELARGMLQGVGSEGVAQFNALAAERKLALLAALAEVRQRLDGGRWLAETQEKVLVAVRLFETAALAARDTPDWTGPFIHVAAFVEAKAKDTLERIAVRQYGRDGGRIQQELHLPDRKVSSPRLTLGGVATSFRVLAKHKDFGWLLDLLDERSLVRLDSLSSRRNPRAHGADTGERGVTAIRHGVEEFIQALDVLEWLTRLEEHVTAGARSTHEEGEKGSSGSDPLGPVLALPERRGRRECGVFISYAMTDREVASRLAQGIGVLGMPVRYDDWAIEPGGSIIEKISERLARNDTLMVLLSPQSVASDWLSRELNTALRTQLAGHNIAVLPVLVEPCEPPANLEGVTRVDLAGDFEAGFVQLLEFLRKRRSRESAS